MAIDPRTEKALDRALKAMSRPPRARRSRWSMAPIMLALALLLGYQLAARLVPMVWGSMLPGGLNQARMFRGWAGLVWTLALRCHNDFVGTVGVLSAIAVVGFFLSMASRATRPIVWLMAVAAIALDAGIVYVTLRTAIEATAQNAGLM